LVSLPRCQESQTTIANYVRVLARLVLLFRDEAVAFFRSAGDDAFDAVLRTWLDMVRAPRRAAADAPAGPA